MKFPFWGPRLDWAGHAVRLPGRFLRRFSPLAYEILSTGVCRIAWHFQDRDHRKGAGAMRQTVRYLAPCGDGSVYKPKHRAEHEQNHRFIVRARFARASSRSDE